MSNVKDFLLKITVFSLLFIMILTCNVNAYTRKSWSQMGLGSYNVSENSTNDFMSKFTNGDYSFGFGNIYNQDVNIEEYDLTSLKEDLLNMEEDGGYISKFEIKGLISKLPDGTDKDMLEKYSKVLYSEARLIEGLNIDNPTEISNLICEMISK